MAYLIRDIVKKTYVAGISEEIGLRVVSLREKEQAQQFAELEAKDIVLENLGVGFEVVHL